MLACLELCVLDQRCGCLWTKAVKDMLFGPKAVLLHAVGCAVAASTDSQSIEQHCLSSMGIAAGSKFERYGSGVQLHSPWGVWSSLILFVLFLPAIALSHSLGLPRKIRIIWARLTGGRGPDVEPSVVMPDGSGFEMSFRSLFSTEYNTALYTIHATILCPPPNLRPKLFLTRCVLQYGATSSGS